MGREPLASISSERARIAWTSSSWTKPSPLAAARFSANWKYSSWSAMITTAETMPTTAPAVEVVPSDSEALTFVITGAPGRHITQVNSAEVRMAGMNVRGMFACRHRPSAIG